MKNLMVDEAPLFAQHERYRKIERLYRNGDSIPEIAKRLAIPVITVRRVLDLIEKAE